MSVDWERFVLAHREMQSKALALAEEKNIPGVAAALRTVYKDSLRLAVVAIKTADHVTLEQVMASRKRWPPADIDSLLWTLGESQNRLPAQQWLPMCAPVFDATPRNRFMWKRLARCVLSGGAWLDLALVCKDEIPVEYKKVIPEETIYAFNRKGAASALRDLVQSGFFSGELLKRTETRVEELEQGRGLG